MTEDQLAAARASIARGVSIRQAAKEIGFHESTLRDRLKKGGGTKLGRFRATFSSEQEKEVVDHCIDLDKRFFGLTLKSLRFLLYKFAEENNLPHQFSAKAQLAGRDFTRAFMKRNKLSLRVPRKTSVARTMGFNKVQLSQYFGNLETVMKKYNFTPSQIFNMDETGVQTVPNILPKHVAPTGKKEVAKAVAAEQGQTVTAVCAVSPVGYFVPPFFIYARKRENRLLIKGGPLGCDMAVTDKGYMNTPTFIKWLKHFQKYAKPSESNPILLILDNHVSHTSLEAVTVAKSNHIHLLTLPPHSSHRTQPLDRCIFRPLKAYYDAAVDSWDVSHPGETFSVYNVAESFKIAFEKASTVENAVQAFKATGIYPLNVNTFSDADFLPSEVTDQPPEEELDVDDRMLIFNDEGNGLGDVIPAVSKEISFDQPSTSILLAGVIEDDVHQSSIHPAIKATSKEDDHPTQTRLTTPGEIIPLPKIKIKRKRKGKGLKSELLTSTPNKERMEKEAAEKEKQATEKEKRFTERKRRAQEQVTKQLFSDANPKKKKKYSSDQYSSETEAEYSVHDSSSDNEFDDMENAQDAGIEDSQQNSELLPNDYVVVKVQGKTKNSFRHYVAKIIGIYLGGYQGVFYKRLPSAYKFSETSEESFIPDGDIVLRLSKPTEMNSARFHNVITFTEDLSTFSMY